MLEKIVEAMKDFETVFQTEHENYTKSRKAAEAKENGYTKIKQNEVITAAYNLMNEKIAEGRSNAMEASTAVFDNIREQLQSVLNQPVQGDLSNTLVALKAMKDPSKTELEALTEQYKGNYFAYRAICDALGGSAMWHVITVDDVLKACDELETVVSRAISGNPSDYMFRLLIQPDCEYVKQYEDLFAAFIEGRFEDAASVSTTSDQTAAQVPEAKNA